VPDEFILGIRQRQHLSRSAARIERRACGFLLENAFVTARQGNRRGTGIKALRFSKIVLEILFLIAYHLNEFR
jgi:hypothetical protein